MRIALDARSLYAPQHRGIARTLLEMYRALAEIRPHWQIIAYHRQPDAAASRRDLPPNFVPKCIEMPGDRFAAWLNCRLPLAVWRDRADLLHCPANACPHRSRVPLVVTLHDLIPLDLPDTCTPGQVRDFHRWVRAAVARAAAITCPSAYTAKRIVGEYHFHRPCFHIPWGAPPRIVTSDARLRELRTQYQLNRPFVIHFGAADPRKNTRPLLQAWAGLSRTTLARFQLLVVGLDDTTLAKLTAWTQRHNLSQSVSLHPFIPADHVPALLEDAALLAYPSLSEGFGMPILEAFAARTAVLTSNVTSLPEVAGKAARLVDPRDPMAITAALEDLLNHPPKRQKLISRGERRAAQFTWADAAECFANLLESLAKHQKTKAA